MSIQPADDGGPVGWGIATFVDHGPSAQATARGSVTVDVSVPAEEEPGEGEGGVAPVARQLTVPIEKLAFKIQEASAAEQMQEKEMSKHFARSCSILLSIRNVMRAAEINRKSGEEGLSTKQIEVAAAAAGKSVVPATRRRRSAARGFGDSRFLAHNIDA